MNASELERTLTYLDSLGRLEVVDAARLQMLRSMATQLDRDPSNAALWRQYREALADLLDSNDSGSLDEDIDALFSDVRDSPTS